MKAGDSVREWLRTLRGDRSTTDIAKELGISQQYYSYIENEERQKKMDLQLCKKISKLFGVSVADIVEFESKTADE